MKSYAPRNSLLNRKRTVSSGRAYMLVATASLLAGVGLLLLSGCDSSGDSGQMPKQRPADLTITYDWRAGSMPPPYHYEYTITIGPGATGKVQYIPDYPGEKVPTWTETFTPTDEQLDKLYTLMMEKGVFGNTLRAKTNPPVGGSIEWVSISGGGKQVSIPKFPEGTGADQVEEVYSAVKAVVPQPTWDKLEAQREAYEAEYEKSHK